MKNFLNGVVKTFGVSISAFIYSIYLLLHNQVPYDVEKSLKPGNTKKYIMIEIGFYVCCLILLISLTICLNFLTNIPIIIMLHAFLFVFILVVSAFLKNNLFISGKKAVMKLFIQLFSYLKCLFNFRHNSI